MMTNTIKNNLIIHYFASNQVIFLIFMKLVFLN